MAGGAVLGDPNHYPVGTPGRPPSLGLPLRRLGSKLGIGGCARSPQPVASNDPRRSMIPATIMNDHGTARTGPQPKT